MQTKEPKESKDLEKSPFYGLFQKHPWLIPILTLLNRFIGIYREFHEINVKPPNSQRHLPLALSVFVAL